MKIPGSFGSLRNFILNITAGKFQKRTISASVVKQGAAPASLCRLDTTSHIKSWTQSSSTFGRWISKEILQNAPNKVVSVRKYVPTNAASSSSSSNAVEACWNCKKQMTDKNVMLCPSCGHLQDICVSINYFDLLDFPQEFDIKLDQLSRRFRQLQSVVHPDKFSTKSEREQQNSADWSSLINKAYKTLSVPIERGQYLLKLNGMQIPQDNSALDRQFLMEMMERNEEIEEASSAEELNKINDDIKMEIEKQILGLSQAFGDKDLNGAKNFLVKMKYFLSMQRTLKAKLQEIS